MGFFPPFSFEMSLACLLTPCLLALLLALLLARLLAYYISLIQG